MAFLFRDDFTALNGTQLDAHTPGPLDPGGSIWEYITAAAAPYSINSNAVRDDGTGIANPARVSAILLDDFIESTSIFFQGGPLTLAQTGQLHICVEEGAIKASPGRITAEVNSIDGIIIRLFDDSGGIRNSGGTIHGRNLTIPFEMGVTKAENRIEIFVQDIGGGNRVTESTILTPTEQALYEDGAHRMTGISCTGTQAGHFVCEFLQVADFIQKQNVINTEVVSTIPVSKDIVISIEITDSISVSKTALVNYEVGPALSNVCEEVPQPLGTILCPVPNTISCSS